jgi:hypothetical protein
LKERELKGPLGIACHKICPQSYGGKNNFFSLLIIKKIIQMVGDGERMLILIL